MHYVSRGQRSRRRQVKVNGLAEFLQSIIHFECIFKVVLSVTFALFRGGKSSSGGYEGGGKNLHLDEGVSTNLD